jgi:phosphomannomutase/phosphoglucomutase
MPSSWPYDLPRSGRDAITLATGALDGSLFREYDIRGRVDPSPPDAAYPLNPFVAQRIARAFGTWLREHAIAEVVVGYDGRSYSEPLASAVVLGLLGAGLDVTNIGLATTPMVYFAQHRRGGVAGVSVTASHNPNGWAGMKLALTPTVTLGPDEIAAVERIARSRELASGHGTYREESFTQDYVHYLARLVPAPHPLRVVVDGANSVAGPIAIQALEAAGYDVVRLNEELDWSFPNHEPDPESLEARIQVGEEVTATAAACGVSFDGDGDRLGVTDDTGAMVYSDTVLAILARDVLARHPGSPIVFDVKCSRVVSDVVEANGGRPVMWKTGHSLIKAKMQEVGAPFAGERSGHFFDAGDYLGFDDAIYTALRFLHIVAEDRTTVSALTAALPRYSGTPTMQADCPDADKYRVVERFAEFAATVGARELIRVNGVRAEFDDGWLLVRASSNLPALVMIAEATSDARLAELYDLLRTGLGRSPEVGEAWHNDPWQRVPA